MRFTLTKLELYHYNPSSTTTQIYQSFFRTMLFNTALSRLIAMDRTRYLAFTLKSVPYEAASKAPYKHAHTPSDFALYSQKQQGRSGMRFAILLEIGVLRVFHCPVLVEDTCETPPTPTVVALLSDNIHGSTYISIDSAVFTSTALVLMS